MKGQLKEGAFIFISNIYSCLTEKEEIQKHSQTAIFINQFVSELHSFVNYIDGCRQTWIVPQD